MQNILNKIKAVHDDDDGKRTTPLTRPRSPLSTHTHTLAGRIWWCVCTWSGGGGGNGGVVCCVRSTPQYYTKQCYCTMYSTNDKLGSPLFDFYFIAATTTPSSFTTTSWWWWHWCGGCAAAASECERRAHHHHHMQHTSTKHTLFAICNYSKHINSLHNLFTI